LRGVTRDIVLELASNMGYDIETRAIYAPRVYSADEVFITSTTRLVWPVVKVNRKKFPVGPVTLGLRKAYLKYRRDYFKENFIGIV